MRTEGHFRLLCLLWLLLVPIIAAPEMPALVPLGPPGGSDPGPNRVNVDDIDVAMNILEVGSFYYLRTVDTPLEANPIFLVEDRPTDHRPRYRAAWPQLKKRVFT